MIERKDIEKLAELSRIDVPEGEKESLRKDIDSILAYVSQIKEVHGSIQGGDEKKAGVLRNVMREDSSPHESGMHTEALLNSAPKREGGYLKVKKILG
jgi:aspartyl-tRNA(Asn)/glutamyl-tRNA(Gln) amidotransferase subunit C